MRHSHKIALAALTLAAGVLASGRARAADPTTADCLSASESSLSLRGHHRLREARAQLLICSAGTCPADIRNECVRRVDEINAAMPTIVFETKDPAGNDVGGVKVTMDGQLLAERLEGTAVSIDPGAHSFSFEAEGRLVARRQFVIREGEKERRELVVLAGADEAVAWSPSGGAVVTASGVATEAPSEPSIGTQKLIALVAAGVGVTALAVGIGYGVEAQSLHDDASKACPGTCATQRGVELWNQAISSGNVATIGFIVGGVALAGGAVLWLTAPASHPATEGTRVGFGPGNVVVKGVW
jgi:hypothetical protein